MQSRLRSFVSRRRSFYVALMPSDSVAIVIALPVSLASWLYFRFDQTGITGLSQVM